MQGGKGRTRRGCLIRCLSPRKHRNLPKRVENLDDFQEDIRRNGFEYYNKDEFPIVKKATLTLMGK
jgi:hypothetical protein